MGEDEEMKRIDGYVGDRNRKARIRPAPRCKKCGAIDYSGYDHCFTCGKSFGRERLKTSPETRQMFFENSNTGQRITDGYWMRQFKEQE
jgi:hypothetical protein